MAGGSGKCDDGDEGAEEVRRLWKGKLGKGLNIMFTLHGRQK